MMLKLHTPMKDYENLHSIADKGRSRMIEVPRKELKNLLMDHSNMVARFEKELSYDD